MGGVCNPALKKKTDFQKLRGGNHILNIEVNQASSTSTLVIAQFFIVFNSRGIMKDSRLCTEFFIFCFFCIDVSPDRSLISVDYQSTHCHFR